MTRKPKDLIGKKARGTYHSTRAHGTVYGTVRAIDAGPRKGLVAVVIQRPKPGHIGKSYAARCQGERVRIDIENASVYWRGEFISALDWLENRKST
jgi:hypothetical protein